MNDIKRALDNLSTSPTFRTVLSTSEVKRLLLQTEGWCICQGLIRNIRSKRIGPGVHEVFSVEKK